MNEHDQIRKRELKVIENLEHLNSEIATASKNLNKASEEVEWTGRQGRNGAKSDERIKKKYAEVFGP